MTCSDVRQLDGDDLARLPWADLAAVTRSLGEAALLVPRVDEFDYLAACDDGGVVGMAAVGYRTPYGGASAAALVVDPRIPRGHRADPAAVLLARLEARAAARTCLSVDVRVDVDDVGTLALVEGRGYGLVGATTTVFPAAEEVVDRHVDSWVLRKEL